MALVMSEAFEDGLLVAAAMTFEATLSLADAARARWLAAMSTVSVIR